MRIIYNKILPPKGYSAINLFGVVFARYGTKLSERTIRHEKIHSRQQKEMLYLLFFLWYGIEWTVRLIQYRNIKAAYYNISFEREAYNNQDDLEYLKERRFWSFVKYLKM